MAPIFSDSVRTCLFEVGGEGGQKQRNKFVFYVFFFFFKKGKLLLLFEVDVLWNILRSAFRRRRVLLKRQRQRKKSSVFGAFKHVDQLLLPTIYIYVLHSKYSMHPLFHVLNLV